MISNEILLLKIIKDNGSLSLLRHRGLSYSQIALLIQDQQRNENIAITGFRFEITEKGLTELNNQLSNAFPKKKDQWILRQEKYYHEPLSSQVIYLPKSKKL